MGYDEIHIPAIITAIEGLAGMVELPPLCIPGRGVRSKAVAFHNPQALSNVQEGNLSCARDQVVIARPPVLTPPWRYRRSLVSKGRFDISINVVIDYVGDLLRHARGEAGCWLFRGL
jgi:hypothetical protein